MQYCDCNSEYHRFANTTKFRTIRLNQGWMDRTCKHILLWRIRDAKNWFYQNNNKIVNSSLCLSMINWFLSSPNMSQLKTVLRTHLILMRIRIPTGKMDPDPGDEHYFHLSTDSFNKIRIFFYFFMQQL